MDLAILAVLLSAFLHPLVSVFAKKAANPLTVNVWAVVIVSFLFSFVFFRSGFWPKVSVHAELIVVSAVVHVVYAVLVLKLVVQHDFQVLYPLTRLAPILILMGEIFILGTEFSWIQISGVFMLVSGALIFGLDKSIQNVKWTIFGSVLFIALLIAGYYLVDKKLVENFTPVEMWAMTAFQLPLILPALWLYPFEAKQDLKNWKNLLGFTLCMVGTWSCVLYALQTLDSTVVSSVRNLSILFGVFLGAHLFDEGHKWLRYLAAALISSGVFLVF